MKITVLGIDLAKTSFQLHGMDELGRPVLKKRLMRDEVLRFTRELVSGATSATKLVIGMEACGGSHYWARKFKEQGHEVRQFAGH